MGGSRRSSVRRASRSLEERAGRSLVPLPLVPVLELDVQFDGALDPALRDEVAARTAGRLEQGDFL